MIKHFLFDQVDVSLMAVQIEDEFDFGGDLVTFLIVKVASCRQYHAFSDQAARGAGRLVLESDQEQSDAAVGVDGWDNVLLADGILLWFEVRVVGVGEREDRGGLDGVFAVAVGLEGGVVVLGGSFGVELVEVVASVGLAGVLLPHGL
jgi:hypothetical protein